MVKVAEWTDIAGIAPVSIKYTRIKNHDIERNKTYVITSILDEPFLMIRDDVPGKVLEGNDKYVGYCKDLADLIAKRLDINCKIAIYLRMHACVVASVSRATTIYISFQRKEKTN